MRSFLGKMLMICFVGALLLIAGLMVRDVVSDRMQYREQARSSITESLVGAQRIAGVTLVIPYTEHYQEKIVDPVSKAVSYEARRQTRYLDLLPETLAISGNMMPDKRHRGIFKVNGYTLHGRLSGHFLLPPQSSLEHRVAGSTLELGKATLVLAVSDPRGLRRLEMKVDGTPLTTEPGTGLEGTRAGTHAGLPDIAARMGRRADFDVALDLVGTDSLSIVPLGRDTTASLNAPWPHPSFGGRFLPVEREINDVNFQANWRIPALATNARDVWFSTLRGGKATEALDEFSVTLLEPVDIYVLADRASKYAELFIALTLGAFLLFELLRRLGLHPLHYLMIGAALLMFFLLLLSLSEHLGFGLAYLVASSACVLLIGFYSAHLLRSLWLASGFTAGLGTMYGALYGILLSEQNALLMGSLLVFALLAAVMIGTRKVDWHALLSDRNTPVREEA